MANKLIVGLGNPGKKYAKNRHNIGFMVVDAISTRIQKSKSKNQIYNQKFKNSKKLAGYLLQTKNFILAKPQTFMNESGKSVGKLVSQFGVKTSDLWVIHDDLDINLGSYKIQKGRGPREHGGLLSIEKKLKTRDFWRVRVGIENRKISNSKSKIPKISGEEYVLQDFTDEERKVLKKVIEEVVKDLLERVANL